MTELNTFALELRAELGEYNDVDKSVFELVRMVVTMAREADTVRSVLRAPGSALRINQFKRRWSDK
jgi:hypothetical protein